LELNSKRKKVQVFWVFHDKELLPMVKGRRVVGATFLTKDRSPLKINGNEVDVVIAIAVDEIMKNAYRIYLICKKIFKCSIFEFF